MRGTSDIFCTQINGTPSLLMQKMQVAANPTLASWDSRAVPRGTVAEAGANGLSFDKLRMTLRDVALRMTAGARFPLDAAILTKLPARLRTVVLSIKRRAYRAVAEFVGALNRLLHILRAYGLLMISPPASWALGMGARVAPAGTVNC